MYIIYRSNKNQALLHRPKSWRGERGREGRGRKEGEGRREKGREERGREKGREERGREKGREEREKGREGEKLQMTQAPKQNIQLVFIKWKLHRFKLTAHTA